MSAGGTAAVVSTVAAVAAAVCFSVAVVYQQEVAVEASRGSSLEAKSIFALIGGVLRRPMWLLATFVDFCGFLLQATALHLGRITIVQPLLITVLLFGMVIGAARSGLHLGLADWTGALLLIAGLAGFLLAAAPSEGDVGAPGGRLPLLCAAAAGLSVLILITAPRKRGAPRAVLLSLAAGVAFALVAALVKEVGAELTAHGPVYVLSDWPVYTLAAVAIGGLSIEQAAFAGGPLVPSLVTLTAVDPIVSIMIGTLVYDEQLKGGGAAAGAVIAGIVGLVGVGFIARSPVTQKVQHPDAMLAATEEEGAAASS
ncbi:MAG TPA: DMT family transporter [Mycobacteriales bacterium]|nr:DMT family transporter [Mycobacteriales bacterium]